MSDEKTIQYYRSGEGDLDDFFRLCDAVCYACAPGSIYIEKANSIK